MQALCILRQADTLRSVSGCTLRCSSFSKRAVWGKSWCWTIFPSCWIACETATLLSAGWCFTLQTQVRLHTRLLLQSCPPCCAGASCYFPREVPCVLLSAESAVSSAVCSRLLSCYFANGLLKSLAETAHRHFLNSWELDGDVKSSMRSHHPVEW